MAENRADTLSLADPQFLVARLHGFQNWEQLSNDIKLWPSFWGVIKVVRSFV